MKQKLSGFKNLLFKPAVSAWIFLVLVVLGTVGIIASNNTFSLSEITSSSTPEGDDANKLTSSKWDSLIARVAEMSGNIQDALRTKNGNDISYNSGTVTVGNNFLAGGSIKVGNTTESCSSATAGSIKYANGCLSYCNGSVWKDFSCETTTGSTPSTPKTWFGTIYRDLLEWWRETDDPECDEYDFYNNDWPKIYGFTNVGGAYDVPWGGDQCCENKSRLLGCTGGRRTRQLKQYKKDFTVVEGGSCCRGANVSDFGKSNQDGIAVYKRQGCSYSNNTYCGMDCQNYPDIYCACTIIWHRNAQGVCE